jgi:delta-aminolevulinic acid dehydratase/porphobilinogen synthase
LVAQTSLEPRHLVLPMFVADGIDEPRPIASMPGVVQHTRDSLRRAASDAVAAGVGGLMLFGVPRESDKDSLGTCGIDPDGILNVALRDLAEDLGPAGGSGAALVVPADVNLEPHVRLTVYQAQFGLVDSGWRTEQTDRRSSVLAAEPGDARALLLMDDVDPPPGRWRQVGRYDTVVVWRRD